MRSSRHQEVAMSALFVKRPKAKKVAKQALDTQMAPGLKEITDTNQDRAGILRELRRRRQLSVLKRNTEEPAMLKRRLGGR